MASTDKTELLKLPQWQDNDKLEMTDLNDAFEKVDTGLTTHLADMTPKLSTLSTSLPTSANRISRSGNVVTIEFYSAGAITGANTIATVPVDYRPSTTVNLFASFKMGDNLANYMVSVEANGNIIQVLTGGELTSIAIFGTYII